MGGQHRFDVHNCNQLQVKTLAKEAGVQFLTVGFDPLSAKEDVPIMPKARYDIMRAYMPTVGTLGLDMMLRSCTIQVTPHPRVTPHSLDCSKYAGVSVVAAAAWLQAAQCMRPGTTTAYL